MMTFLDCWIAAATALFSQALAGEPELVESVPKPLDNGVFGFAATVTGEQAGRFSVIIDASILSAPLMGDETDQKTGWGELLREIANAAAGELLAKTGQKCHVENFEPTEAEDKVSRAFALRSAVRVWTILVCDDVRAPERAADTAGAAGPTDAATEAIPGHGVLSPSMELLLDVELEATLRFGCRELPLGQVLDLGPGDVVQLDRQVSDPVDLIVGDKIVARGQVVLVNGNFGLRVTEVAAPRKRLESIRCLF
jgi:flagellar motor switch protein FliN